MNDNEWNDFCEIAINNSEHDYIVTQCIQNGMNTLEWKIRGIVHRRDDLPAIVYQNGNKVWVQNGRTHRNYVRSTHDKPAIEYSDGTQVWYCNGDLHRSNNLPAVIYNPNTKHLYKHGVYLTPEAVTINSPMDLNPDVEYWEEGIQRVV